GGPRGATGCGQNLHDVRAIHDGQRRLADECFSHARPETVFWRHVFSAGRPSFLQLLQHISQLWQERQKDILVSAGDIHARLESAMATAAEEKSSLNADVLKNATDFFKKIFDPQHGGFGNAPKFPQPSMPSLLLRCAKRFSDEEAKQMVLKTCAAMAAGGIHDQLG